MEGPALLGRDTDRSSNARPSRRRGTWNGGPSVAGPEHNRSSNARPSRRRGT